MRCPVRLKTAPTGARGKYRINRLFAETSSGAKSELFQDRRATTRVAPTVGGTYKRAKS